MQMPERYRARCLVADQPLQLAVARIRPNVFVIRGWIGVYDQQLAIRRAEPQAGGQLGQPRNQTLTQLGTLPRNLGFFIVFERFAIHLRDVAIRVATHALRVQLDQPLQHLLRFGTVHAVIARADDNFCAALPLQIRKASVETGKISMDVRKNSDAHGTN